MELLLWLPAVGVENRRFQSYLKPGWLYDSHQLLELTMVAFRATQILPSDKVDIPVNRSFPIYQNSVNW